MNNTITKKDLIAKLAIQMSLSKAESKKLFNDLIAVIIEMIVKHGTLKIHRFGSFIIRQKNKHMGKNFVTMDKIVLPQYKTVSFRPSKEIKRLLNCNV